MLPKGLRRRSVLVNGPAAIGQAVVTLVRGDVVLHEVDQLSRLPRVAHDMAVVQEGEKPETNFHNHGFR
jgi:hypothetical protein